MIFAFDRQKNVVFPLDLSAETPRTMAGCCRSCEKHASYGEKSTHKRHDSERILDLLPCAALFMQFFQARCAWPVRLSSCVGGDQRAYTRSVHWTSFLRSFIFLRSFGAKTSRTHRSES